MKFSNVIFLCYREHKNNSRLKKKTKRKASPTFPIIELY